MKQFFLIIAFGVLMSVSCKKEKSCEGCMKNNKPPVADAGINQIISLPRDSILLDGSSSKDLDGKINEWDWKKISGPASFKINNSTFAKTSVKNLTAGVYYFELKVSDDGGLFSKDTLQILVNAATQVVNAATQNNNNVLFFFRDPTGGLDVENTSVIESFSPRLVLVKVKIAAYPDAEIEGVWSLNYSPWCPISSIYTDATAYGVFNLPPGIYTWTAESVTTNLNGYPVPGSFRLYWSAGSHFAQGTITVQQGANCIIKEIIF